MGQHFDHCAVLMSGRRSGKIKTNNKIIASVIALPALSVEVLKWPAPKAATGGKAAL
jgi:hypothetical protein